MGLREEIGWDVIDGRWKQVRKFVEVGNPEGRLIHKEEKLPPEMENVSATIKQTLEQMGIKDIKPGPAGAWSATLENPDQIGQILRSCKNVGTITENNRVSVYPMMIPEQKEESRNDVPSLNSSGYITTAEKEENGGDLGEAGKNLLEEIKTTFKIPENEIVSALKPLSPEEVSEKEAKDLLSKLAYSVFGGVSLGVIIGELGKLVAQVAQPQVALPILAKLIVSNFGAEIGEVTQLLSQSMDVPLSGVTDDPSQLSGYASAPLVGPDIYGGEQQVVSDPSQLPEHLQTAYGGAVEGFHPSSLAPGQLETEQVAVYTNMSPEQLHSTVDNYMEHFSAGTIKPENVDQYAKQVEMMGQAMINQGMDPSDVSGKTDIDIDYFKSPEYSETYYNRYPESKEEAITDITDAATRTQEELRTQTEALVAQQETINSALEQIKTSVEESKRQLEALQAQTSQ